MHIEIRSDDKVFTFIWPKVGFLVMVVVFALGWGSGALITTAVLTPKPVSTEPFTIPLNNFQAYSAPVAPVTPAETASVHAPVEYTFNADLATDGPTWREAFVLDYPNDEAVFSFTSFGKEMFRIEPNGHVELAEGVDWSEAAETFWDAVESVGYERYDYRSLPVCRSIGAVR